LRHSWHPRARANTGTSRGPSPHLPQGHRGASLSTCSECRRFCRLRESCVDDLYDFGNPLADHHFNPCFKVTLAAPQALAPAAHRDVTTAPLTSTSEIFRLRSTAGFTSSSSRDGYLLGSRRRFEAVAPRAAFARMAGTATSVVCESRLQSVHDIGPAGDGVLAQVTISPATRTLAHPRSGRLAR